MSEKPDQVPKQYKMQDQKFIFNLKQQIITAKIQHAQNSKIPNM